MLRYVVPIVVVCLYIVGASWIVHNEGRSYRKGLAEKPLAAVPVPGGSPIVNRGPKQAAEVKATSPRPAIATVEPVPTSAVRPGPEQPEMSVPAASIPAQASTLVAVPTAKTAVASAEPERLARIAQLRKDPFWSRPELTKAWPVEHLTSDDEHQLGAQLNELILLLNPPERNGAGLRRVNEAATPLLDLIHAKRGEYRFFVLDSDVANAFSHPGGYIYVSRKLLEMIPTNEPAPLEFVLAHEIYHLEHRHAVACLNMRDVRSFSDGTLPKLYFLIIPHGFQDQFEFDADGWAYNKLRQLGRSEHDCRKFLRLVDSYAKANGFENGRGKLADLFRPEDHAPSDRPGHSPIENHLRSHPAAYERLKALKQVSGARP